MKHLQLSLYSTADYINNLALNNNKLFTPHLLLVSVSSFCLNFFSLFHLSLTIPMQSQVSPMNRALYLAIVRAGERLGALGFAQGHALPIQSNDPQNSLRITECLLRNSILYTRRETLISSKKHKLQHAGL